LEIAISGLISESVNETTKVSIQKIPVFNSKRDTKQLADLVEQKSFSILPNLVDCVKCHPLGECGQISCYEYAKAIIEGKTNIRCCPLELKEKFSIEVNGIRLPIKEFPQEIIQKSIIGMISSLHGVKEIKSLKIEINR
ncbi:MAG: hypothetical protein GX638_15220, partial [Crenarchaeota archaeon]|nr:hypothetical protein [Thermoproteota archaeon]